MATRTRKITSTKSTAAGDPASGALVTRREFNKANDSIGLRLREGKLTLLSRKLYNLMVFAAQRAGKPGEDSPIESEANKKYFWVRMADLAADVSYNSSDVQLLKDHLDELQNIKVFLDTEREWASERLISSVKFANPAGLNKRGGELWLGYSFPPEVHEHVMHPGQFTRFSIHYQAVFRSGSSLALYELCRRYATNPSHVTQVDTYAYWYHAITSNPIDGEIPEYKYFKRDTLKPALLEINEGTDIEVELIEIKSGRKVVKLQFQVHLSKQPSLPLSAPPLINTALIGELVALGFTSKDAQDVCGSHTDEEIRSTLSRVQGRMSDAKMTPLDAPAAYFRWAIKNPEKVIAKAIGKTGDGVRKEGKKPPSPMDLFLAARSKGALAAYNELSKSEAETVMARFRQSSAGRLIKKDKGIDHPMVKSNLGRWYALELWGEPTPENLSSFMELMTVDAE